MKLSGFKLEWTTSAGFILGIETLEDGQLVYGKWEPKDGPEGRSMVPTPDEATFLVASAKELVNHMPAWLAPKPRPVAVEVLSATPNAALPDSAVPPHASADAAEAKG